jgi:hypothetical protein
MKIDKTSGFWHGKKGMMIVLFVVALCVIAALVFSLKPWGEHPISSGRSDKPSQSKDKSLSKAYELVERKTFSDYEVRVFRDKQEGDGYFDILRKGKIVHRQEGWKFTIGHLYDDDPKYSLIQMGKDITGDGVPNLVISEYSGGAHCCLSFEVFEMGAQLRHIDRIEAEDGDLSHFEDLDGDRSLECIINDWNFSYWKTSFADSPAPRVILRYRNGKYRFAGDLMRKQSPTNDEIAKMITKIHRYAPWTVEEPPPELWSYMLDLIYSGHAEIAWAFFEQAWPSSIAGKKVFLKEFQDQLTQSRFWKDVEKLNKE